MSPVLPEGGSTHRDAARPSLWSAVRGWRDWGIPLKLAAVTLVPVVFAIVLGVLQIGSQIDRADSYRRVDQLVTVDDALRKTVTWLQRERTKAAVLLTSGSRDIAVELLAEQRSADTARDAMVAATTGIVFTNQTTAARYNDVVAAFGDLDALRAQVRERQIDGPTALGGYTTAVRALIAFDRATAQEIADPSLAATAAALHDLEAAKEEVHYQQALVGVGIARGALTRTEIDALRASQTRLDDRTADFRAIADPAQQADYDRMLPVPDTEARASLVRTALTTREGAALPVTAIAWNGASELISGKLSNLSTGLGARISAGSAALQDTASDAAGLASVVLIVALVAAAAIMFMIGRHLLRSLSALRRGALDVAERGLPDAVARIRDGKPVDVDAVEPVAVGTSDEVGQVASAFDAVHRQALRLATEQAGMRANYAGVFVNLSRRSQGLVQRQLQLLERLERDEEDADQLATLFQLDHLATRMRRNNENLMVLSGSTGAETRRSQRPVSLADLLRAAVSEVEQYQRVVIAAPPAVLIVGYAAGDLVRLTAELLDNAAAFSAPATQVTVSSHHSDGVVRIEVADRGIGMTPDELAEANERLAQDGGVDASTSRRMGLFVVGRLAARHGVSVRLRASTPAGLRAIVTVPGDLVASAPQDTAVLSPVKPTTPSDEPKANGANGSAANGSQANGSQANGSQVNGTAKTNGAANGSHVNGSAKNGGVVNGATANGLPRRRTATGGDGASMPESLPTQRESVDPTPKPTTKPTTSPKPAGEEVSWPSHPVPAGLTEDARPAEELFHPAVPSQPEPPKDEGSGWWDATVIFERPPGLAPERGVQETTPIFDAMVSAWFRTITDDPNSTAADADRGPAWDFAADQGFQTARAVSQTQPETFTASGLPRRTPRGNLVPGSAQPTTGPATPPIPERDAEDLRARLSNYQRGVHRARGAHHVGPAHGEPELDLRGARWRFAADDAWRAAETVGKSTEDSEDGALPRRTPRERLLPGSLDPMPGTESALIERDADALRTRLGSLQRGIGRGRDSLARQAQPSGVEQDHGNGA